MQVTCPKDATHKRFYVTAHVMEEWIVDEGGNWQYSVEGGSGGVVHKPDTEDLYTCRDCGTEAKATS